MQSDLALSKISEILKDEGYRAKLSSDGSFITSGVGGMKISIYAYENDSIQLVCGVNLDDNSEFGVEQANAYNRRYRYAKVYIDSDSDVVLSGDYFVELEKDTAPEYVRQIMSNFDACVALFRGALAEVTEGQLTAGPPDSDG